MDKREIRFELLGFDEPCSFVPFLRALVTRLHDHSPKGTTTTASFVKAGDGVTGAVLLCTPLGVFSSRAQGRNGHLIARWIAKELGRQLRRLPKMDVADSVVGAARASIVRGHLRLLPS